MRSIRKSTLLLFACIHQIRWSPTISEQDRLIRVLITGSLIRPGLARWCIRSMGPHKGQKEMDQGTGLKTWLLHRSRRHDWRQNWRQSYYMDLRFIQEIEPEKDWRQCYNNGVPQARTERLKTFWTHRQRYRSGDPGWGWSGQLRPNSV